jgi:hypothetical protein
VTARQPAEVILHGDARALDRVALVTVPGATPVRVRFRFDGGGMPWRCDSCGRSRLPRCLHAAHVADTLLRELLDAPTHHHTRRAGR